MEKYVIKTSEGYVEEIDDLSDGYYSAVSFTQDINEAMIFGSLDEVQEIVDDYSEELEDLLPFAVPVEISTGTESENTEDVIDMGGYFVVFDREFKTIEILLDTKNSNDDMEEVVMSVEDFLVIQKKLQELGWI